MAWGRPLLARHLSTTQHGEVDLSHQTCIHPLTLMGHRLTLQQSRLLRSTLVRMRLDSVCSTDGLLDEVTFRKHYQELRQHRYPY